MLYISCHQYDLLKIIEAKNEEIKVIKYLTEKFFGFLYFCLIENNFNKR